MVAFLLYIALLDRIVTRFSKKRSVKGGLLTSRTLYGGIPDSEPVVFVSVEIYCFETCLKVV